MPDDLTPLLTRRRALQALGVIGAATLLGCGGDDDPAASSSTTSGSATGSGSGAGSGSCEAIPGETAGPFPGDGTNGPDVLAQDGVVRSDIRSSFGSSTTTAQGVPLTIHLDLVDVARSCSPLSGAAVYLWHCDREGRYSMYSEGAEDENYLRGVQAADVDGRVTFRSIFPAAYPGRWPHLHFEVYESLDAATGGGATYTTSQLAFPEDTCDEVFATDGYARSASNMDRTPLSNDGVFGEDEAEHQMGTTTGNPTDGYEVTLTVSVDTTTSSS